MVRFAFLTGCLVLSLATPVQSTTPNNAGACSVMAATTNDCARSWASGNRFMVRGMTARENKQVEWHYEFAANRDLKLDIRINSNRTNQAGALLLIDNRTMVTQGLPATAGEEFDTLGVPVLVLQLVVDLLQRAIPGGPDALGDSRKIEITDSLKPLAITAGNARGLIPAPWTLSGTATHGSGSSVEFDITLSFQPIMDGAIVETMGFSGYWDKRPNAPVLPDSTKIEGWAVHRISRYSNRNADQTISGFRTTPVSTSFATVGAVRRHFSDDGTEETP